MISREMEIKIPSVLDPSTIALFIQIASQYESVIYVEKGTARVNAKSIMGMMTLGMDAGEALTVITDGADEAEAMDSIEKYLTDAK